MVKAWNQFWATIAMAFSSLFNVAETVNIATEVARDEAKGQAHAMSISRNARHAVLTSEAEALVASLKPAAKAK